MIETFKILKGLERVEEEKWFTLSENVPLRGHELKLEKSRARLDIRKNFFSHRIISAWNRLPINITKQETVQGFKKALDKYWSINGYGYQTCL